MPRASRSLSFAYSGSPLSASLGGRWVRGVGIGWGCFCLAFRLLGVSSLTPPSFPARPELPPLGKELGSDGAPFTILHCPIYSSVFFFLFPLPRHGPGFRFSRLWT